MIKTTTKNSGEVLYDAPSVNVLDVQSEGLLCVSSTGIVIDDATEENWGTLN